VPACHGPFLEVYSRVKDALGGLRGMCFEPRPIWAAPARQAPNAVGCAAAGLLPRLLDPTNRSVFEGKGTEAVGGDPAFRYFFNTQVREGTECWRIMRLHGVAMRCGMHGCAAAAHGMRRPLSFQRGASVACRDFPSSLCLAARSIVALPSAAPLHHDGQMRSLTRSGKPPRTIVLLLPSS